MDIIFILILVFTIIGAIAKHFRTQELSSKLGREVADHELVSLNSWLEAEKKAETKRKVFKRKVVNYQTANGSNETRSDQISQKNAPSSSPATVTTPPEKRPDNCPNCGAVLSKELAYCEFCNRHISQREVERHCAVFLFDMQEDLIRETPISYRLLKTAAWLVPLVVFAVLMTSNVFMEQLSNRCTMLSVTIAIAFVIRYCIDYLAENRLKKTDSANFDFLYAPQIKGFIARHQLQNVEFMSIACCHLEKDSRLLKQIHRYL